MINQFIRSMGGIRLNDQQLRKLIWLAQTRNVSQEQILSDIVDEYLGKEVPLFSLTERAKMEQELRTLATKFNKSLNQVKTDIRANKGHRYHLNDTETKSYRDFLTLTGQ